MRAALTAIWTTGVQTDPRRLIVPAILPASGDQAANALSATDLAAVAMAGRAADARAAIDVQTAVSFARTASPVEDARAEIVANAFDQAVCTRPDADISDVASV
jgi:hypothetical protein